MKQHTQHDQFIPRSELHNRLLAALCNLDLFERPEDVFIRDMAARFGIGCDPIPPTPKEAVYLTAGDAARMGAITYTLILHDIAWAIAEIAGATSQGNHGRADP